MTRCRTLLLTLSLVLAMGCGGDQPSDAPQQGELGQPCLGGGICNGELVCEQGVCMQPDLTWDDDDGKTDDPDPDPGDDPVVHDPVTAPDAGIGAPDAAPASDAAPAPDAIDDPGDCDCADLGPCMPLTCVAGECVYRMREPGSECDDGDLCSYGDTCDAEGRCMPKAFIECSDDPGTCGAKRACNGTSQCTETYPENTPCSDDNPCTELEVCNGAGKCVGEPVALGTPCSDGNICTQGDSCSADGHCQPGAPLQGWQQVAKIEYTQNDPDGHWATEQQETWVADRRVTGVQVSGSSDDGGYCYAFWHGGHVARYRHSGLYGLYNVDDKYYGAYNNPCPTYPPRFDNAGGVQICQGTSNSGGFKYGEGTKTGLSLPEQTKIRLKARHAIGRSGDRVLCYLSVRCD